MNNSYLAHHGVLGMKWGVRRYQNRDGSLTAQGKARYAKVSDHKIIINADGSKVVPDGFIFNRVGKSHLDINESGALYVSYGTPDAARYIKYLGPSLIGDLLKQSHDTVQHITAKSNIRVMSDKDFTKIVVDILYDEPNALKDFNRSLYSALYANLTKRETYYNVTRKDLERIRNNYESKEALQLAYSVNSAFGDPGFKNTTSKLYDKIRNSGYDAINDIHDILTGTSETAMIILNPNKLELTSTTHISKDISKEAKAYVKTLSKLKVSELVG